ncbi:MAG TPA: branched-chain amino acid ABC transporter substrate-binding protein [Candidatus Deferrimicrobium sp.]|nr:branched-chain amino acid ABC transporter substrate-binding protein [Candidatus Deferrimicrobium sp.]
MMRKNLGVFAAAGLLAVAVAGPVSAQAPEDPLGVVEIPAGEPVVIAGWGVLSGANASLGQDWINSMMIAADDRGNELKGHPIEIITEDAGCSPEGGASAAQKLASNPSLVGLIGSACSDETVGGIAALTNAGLTTISPSNTRPALTAPDRGPEFAGYMRTAFNDASQGKAVSEFVFNELGLTKAATVHDGSAYAEALVGVFEEEFAALGGEIVASEAIQVGQTDMKPVLTSVAAAGPEAIYYPIFTAEGGFMTAQSKEVSGLESVALIGSDGMFSADMVKGAGAAANGMYLSSPDFSAFQAGYQDLLDKYMAKFGINPPQAFHAHGYDAAGILLNAIEKVSVEGEDGTLYVPKGALRDELFATKDYPGVTGPLTCTPTGDCGAQLIAVYQLGQAEVDGAWPPAAPIWSFGG